jgi:hypothetical protein
VKRGLQHAQPTVEPWTAAVSPPISRGIRPRRSRLERRLARLSATLAVAVGGFAGYLVLDASLRSEAPVVATAPAVERPASAPGRVPPWAWELHRWQLTPPAVRGERPGGAPARLPGWYWDWRAWRLAVAQP